MTVSLSVFLDLCLKGIKLAIATVLFTRIKWSSWSETPLIMSMLKTNLIVYHP
jgi:hypothetical protein